MPQGAPTRQAAIAAALAAARTGDTSVDVRVPLAGIEPSSAAGTRADELWLSAELAYRAGRYRESVRAFRDYDARSEAASAPSWQRYLSVHRQSFGSLQLGRAAECARAIDRAEAIVADDPELRAKAADVTAMRAHLAELRSNFEAAWILFERAHEEAIAAGNLARARTAASDLGRVAAILNRPADGLRWLRTARELPGSASPLVAATIRLREGILSALLGLHADALQAFSDAVDASSGLPGEVAVDARARRADVLAETGRTSEAAADLYAASEIARERGLARHELYCHKDLSSLFARAHDAESAAREFREAVRLALSLDPPPLLALRQLLEDALAFPAVAGRAAWRTAQREELSALVARLVEGEKDGAYQRAARRAMRESAAADAAAWLERALGRRLELATCSVDFGAACVVSAAGARVRLTPTDVALLRALEAAPQGITCTQLAAALGATVLATEQGLSRLRKKIGASFETERRGRAPALRRLRPGPAVPRTQARR